MNKFRFYFILFSSALILFSCNKSDDSSAVPIRKFAVQYADDIALIEDYLTTHYIEVTNAPGTEADQNVVIKKIDAAQPSIMSLLDSPTFPKLLFKTIDLDDIEYKLYYIKLREDNATGIQPCRVDQVLAAYRGSYLAYNTETVDGSPVTTLEATQFEYIQYPDSFLALNQVIRGWTETFPLFKSGNVQSNPGQPTSYADFGAGVIFIPSGLGYYNQARANLPAYSPLVFNFKLYDVRRSDQDGDGILSINEDLNGNGLFNDDDTDGDGVQNFLDADDDGDGYFTRTETKKPGVDGIFIFSGLSQYYPYDPVADNPFTTENEEEIYGVPSKFTGPPLSPSDPLYSAHSVSTPLPQDYTNPTRLRRYLDKTCFPPYK